MKLKMNGQVILITGASAGIGHEFARQLAAQAKALVLVARRTERLERLKAELLALHPSLVISVQPCDLTDRTATDEMLERVRSELGDVDILINNAGVGDFTFYESSSWSRTEQMIELNVIAPLYLARKLMGPMVKKKSGGILNVSSVAGMHFFPAFAGYVGTKYFLNGFTESLRSELQGSGVVVSQLCPGPVATEFEMVATQRTQGQLPSWVELSPEQCVAWGIRGFTNGKAVIIPGYLINWVTAVYRLTPKLIQRWVARLVGLWIRRSGMTQPIGS